MNILLLLAHSIEEHDQLKLLSGLGYDVFSIGGYIDPQRPHDPKRPALPDVPAHPELQAAVDGLGTDNNLEAAKRWIPDDVLDWADTIICHHYEYNWLWPQWDRIKHKRVIWRTVGQSTTSNESLAAPFRAQGLQIVRYSPREEFIPGYAGADELIRFYKDPEEWNGWTGTDDYVINITQDMAQRGRATGYLYWQRATSGLSAIAAGPGSAVIGGPGQLTMDEMHDFLRRSRVYLYTGTQPASYTLGMIEAMMTGIPIVCIGRSWHNGLAYGPKLFEGPDIIGNSYDNPHEANMRLKELLEDFDTARRLSEEQHTRALELFSKDVVGAKWKAFLG